MDTPSGTFPRPPVGPEASSRILVDRHTIRLDGRPFFTFGPRLLLTPADRMEATCAQIAAAGFSSIVSPPASPATFPVVDAAFDAAERAGLFVILFADPRLFAHGALLAQRYRWRPNLHSYLLPWHHEFPDAAERYRAERAEIRAADLFHPIWAELGRMRPDANWLTTMDLYGVRDPGVSPCAAELLPAAERLSEIARLTAPPAIPKPLLCSSLPVVTTDADREAGLFAEDPAVRSTPPNALHWFPARTDYETQPRRDWLSPDPEQLRLGVYALLSAGVRGILLDFHEGLLGPPPHSGHDRFSECALLAKEIAIFRDFFAEGQPELVMLEAGHPRLRAASLRHGPDRLILLRAVEEEGGPATGDAYITRVEVDIHPDEPLEYRAWRMDFPGSHPAEIVMDPKRALRIKCGTVDQTALLLLTPGRQRAEELATAVSEALPFAARMAVSGFAAQLAKTLLIESELASEAHGIRIDQHLRAAKLALDEACGLLDADLFADAYSRAREGQRELRTVRRVQLARAQLEPIHRNDGRRALLRANYYTLPEFYRARVEESAIAFHEFT